MMRNRLMLPIRHIRMAGARQASSRSDRPLRGWGPVRLLGPLVVGFNLLTAFGCQCCCGTNVWSRVVDFTSDHPPIAQCLYCSKLDLTRINRPGGIQCGCGCPPIPHCASGVYAHRWNSPPNPSGDMQPAMPLESSPYYPDVENQSDQQMLNESPAPLLPPPSMPPAAIQPMDQPMSPGVQATPRAPVEPGEGIQQMHYLRESPYRQGMLVPVDALFSY